MEQLTQICNNCSENLPLSSFHKDKTHKSGYKESCKTCRNNRKKELYKLNIDKVKIQSKLSYERNKERILSYQKEYSKTHYEQINERAKKNYIQHHLRNPKSLKSLSQNCQ